MVIDVETSLLWRLNGIQELTDFWILGIFLVLIAANALGIGAASFASGASKDIAESPTALPERPK
ncbi:MAG: hypothetical protein J6U85_07830 [Bacteroidales bacterium]|nr:hypothetical protein [Bacteroidales bacterium]